MRLRLPPRRWPSPATAAVIGALLLGAPLAATQVKIFATGSQEAFLGGTLDGISVDALGTLRLADRAERLTAVEEPFLLAAAVAPDGWVLGTGNAGRVLHIDRDGTVSTLFETEEPEVFAVFVDADGTVFAGSSPNGRVYRYRRGSAAPEVYFEPGETYIWGLARSGDGDLLVATGTGGKLYEVDPGGSGRLLYDSDDTHLRALYRLADGGTLVGTAGEGLVLLVEPGGRVRTLYDAAQPEIVAFTAGRDGSHYVAALASEASLVDLTRSSSSSSQESRGEGSDDSDDGESSGESQERVTVSGGESVAAGSRRSGFRGPRSEVLRISPAGTVESLWKFDSETVYSLSWHRDRLWVGTGLEGKLYSYRGERMVLEKDVDERQVVVLLADDPGPAFATTNAAAFYRLTGGTERQGEYTSAVLDAGQVARFGSLHWEGEVPPGGAVEFAVRSGISSEPDRTWSDWSAAASGREIPLAGVARGRYLQWRARLEASDGRSPVLNRVEISYLQENQKPEIESLTVLEAGQILVPSNFNPSNQTFEPAHPNREGIFTTLEASSGKSESSRLKTLWKLGYRTLRWEAEDPNDDELEYRLSFRRDGGPEGWLPIGEQLEDSHFSFDATVLPDGRYRFRLEASDRPGNLDPDALVAERVSESVVIDHHPPELDQRRQRESGLRVVVSDRLSPLREAVYSVDAGSWRPATALDGLLDGRREELDLELPEEAVLVLLRVTDAAHNVTTFDLSQSD